jgi:formate dehydrogenase iron-sulfur subunit
LLINPPPDPPRVPGTIQRLPPIAPSEPERGNLIDQLLAEQKRLQTPVAKFSEKKSQLQPDLADHYRSLMPLSKPGDGEQYAFEVSLDRCTGCKACVSACHSLNGLDDDEAWRDTGTLLGGDDLPGWQQTVTSACHHCGDPACLNGCPVGAYEKDAETGIVRHLDDQCIGCSYCILKCPYDVPKYSKKRGIVRKCDMCHQRLAVGEAPACVQACPTEAIRIIKVPVSEPATSHHSLLGNLSITLPTTRYAGRQVPVSATAADREALVPQDAHWPLVLMLILTQSGIGLLLAAAGHPALNLAGNLLFFAGMAASVFHLGQPLKAWRFFLGLRTSWLSREILAFSCFAPLPPLLLACSLLSHFPEMRLPEAIVSILPLAARAATISTWVLGIAAVFTSVMIYHDTRRELWKFARSSARFFGTVASFFALGLLLSHSHPAGPLLFGVVVLLKMIPEARILKCLEDPHAPWSPDLHSARLQRGPLGPVLRMRFFLGFLSIALAMIQPWLAVPTLLLSELCERLLFFRSVLAPKMAGNFGSRNA